MWLALDPVDVGEAVLRVRYGGAGMLPAQRNDAGTRQILLGTGVSV